MKSDSTDHDELNPVAELASEFLDAMRAGKNPSTDEYLVRAGANADELRPLLTMMVSLESVRHAKIESPTTQTSPNAMPVTLGDYQLVREAGRGGMGIVYEAIEIPLNRRVAVKILDQRVVRDPVALIRFQREARAAATLHHTNIVPVFAVGEESGVHFYVMPFIEGETLGQFLVGLRATTDRGATKERGNTDSVARTPTVNASVQEPWSVVAEFTVHPDADKNEVCISSPYKQECRISVLRAAEIVLQIAEALEHANQHGILHRDIKPSNLMLATDGTVWVMDFGLARFAESDDLTCTGEVLGTPRYLAPERLSGQHTIQGDIYATGIVLYELLTLESPFNSADRSELVRQILTLDPVPPRHLRPDIPRDLETIVLKSMAKDPKERYQQPAAFVHDLRSFLSDRPISSRRAGQWELLVRWCRKNRGTASLLASILVLLLIISVGASLWATSLRRERDIAESAEKKSRASEKETSDALLKLEEIDEQHRQDLYRSYLSEMRASFATGRVGQREKGIESLRKLLDVIPFDKLSPEQQKEVTHAAIASLSRSDLRETSGIPVPSNPGHSADVHPDFKFIAIPGQSQRTIIRRIDGSQEDVELVPPVEKSFLHSFRWFSPCGRWIYEILLSGLGGYTNECRVWDWQKKELVLRFENAEHIGEPTFDEAGRFMFLTHELAVEKYDLLCREKVVSSSPRYSGGRVALSGDGKLLSCMVFGRHPVVLDAETLEPVSLLAEISHTECGVWDDERNDFHFGNREGELVLWKPVENVHWFEPRHHPSPITSITLSPDGRYLATTSGTNGSLIRGKNSQEPICSVPGEVIRFSSDSRQVAVRLENEIVFYKIVPSTVWQCTHHSVGKVRFSPDGSWIAANGNQGVLFFSTNPLELVGDLGLDECGPVSWHPHNEELVTFGMFSHVAKWPATTDPTTKALRIGPPIALVINPVLSKLGLDDRVPARYEKFSAWSADGLSLYFVEQHKDLIKRYDVNTGQTVEIVECNGASRLTLSNDGRWMVSVSLPFQAMRIWDLSTRTCVLELPSTSCASFSDDSQRLVVGTRSHSAVLETGTWKVLHEFPADMVHPAHPYDVTFLPKKKLFAAAVSRRTVRLLDASRMTAVADLTYPSDADILSLTFSPDGQRLAVVRATEFDIWDLGALGEELNSIGIPVPALPKRRPLPENRTITSIDRGRDLLAHNEWWKGYELLAKFEMIQGRYSDAIGALSEGLLIVHRGHNEARWTLLTQRATCYLAAGDPYSAHADLEEAVQVKPGDIKTSRALAELRLFGPVSIRDPDSAESLFRQVCDSDTATARDHLYRLLLIVRHHPEIVRNELSQWEPEFMEQFDETEKQLVELIRESSASEFTSPLTTTTAVHEAPDLGETTDSNSHLAIARQMIKERIVGKDHFLPGQD